MVPIEELTALPVLPVNQFRVDGAEDSWAFTRNSDRVYGISGPAPGGQGVICLALPEQLPFMGCENRLWRLEGWRGAFPAYDTDKPKDIDVALPALMLLVPEAARTALLQLHDAYITDLGNVLRSAISFTTDHLHAVEDTDDLVCAARILAGTARQYGLQQVVEVLGRARDERQRSLSLYLDGLPRR